MVLERIIVEEFANISMTLTELLSITNIINSELKNDTFHSLFNKLVDDIDNCYGVVCSNINPLYEIKSEESFLKLFNQCQSTYAANYLIEVSKPRAYAEQAYEDHLELKTLKETKTQFPILKRTFIRLDALIDKWITNDAWLAMYIDNLLKRLHSLLTEITELKNKDPEDAYLIFHSAFTAFEPYLELITQQRKRLKLLN